MAGWRDDIRGGLYIKPKEWCHIDEKKPYQGQAVWIKDLNQIEPAIYKDGKFWRDDDQVDGELWKPKYKKHEKTFTFGGTDSRVRSDEEE